MVYKNNKGELIINVVRTLKGLEKRILSDLKKIHDISNDIDQKSSYIIEKIKTIDYFIKDDYY